MTGGAPWQPEALLAEALVIGHPEGAGAGVRAFFMGGPPFGGGGDCDLGRKALRKTGFPSRKVGSRRFGLSRGNTEPGFAGWGFLLELESVLVTLQPRPQRYEIVCEKERKILGFGFHDCEDVPTKGTKNATH